MAVEQASIDTQQVHLTRAWQCPTPSRGPGQAVEALSLNTTVTSHCKQALQVCKMMEMSSKHFDPLVNQEDPVEGGKVAKQVHGAVQVVQGSHLRQRYNHIGQHDVDRCFFTRCNAAAVSSMNFLVDCNKHVARQASQSSASDLSAPTSPPTQ